MILQVGVKILLKNSGGKYLLVRRNPKKYPEVGAKWDIVGGRIEIGTPLIHNLKREIKEEVGLEYSGEPKLLAAQDILVRKYADDGDNAHAVENIDKHVVRLTYAGEIEGEPKVDDDNLEAKWFSAEEMANIKTDDLDSYLKKLLKNKVINL